MDRNRDRDADEDTAPASKSDLVRAKLKPVAHYAMIGFAPAASVAALIVAVIAVANNQSQPDRTQLNELTSRIDSLNASLSDTKGELENFKFAMAREKTMRGEERKKVDERDMKIVQNVSRLQAKLKVSPTLEDQLRESTSTPVAASSVVASVPTVTPASQAIEKKSAATASEPATAAKKPAVAAPKSKPEAADKTSAQVKALKEAIDKFNKQ